VNTSEPPCDESVYHWHPDGYVHCPKAHAEMHWHGLRVCHQPHPLQEKIASLRCVQAAWAFGVPEDARAQWLELVEEAVRDVCDQ
jgi:hypothetical protein